MSIRSELEIDRGDAHIRYDTNDLTDAKEMSLLHVAGQGHTTPSGREVGAEEPVHCCR